MTWKCRKELSEWINSLPVQPRRVRLARDKFGDSEPKLWSCDEW